MAGSITLPQMTIKNCGADPKDAIRQNKQVFCCRIFGEATAAKTKEARNGDAYTYLIGTFRAQRPATPQEKKDTGSDIVVYDSEKLFLPGGIQEKIESQLTASQGKPVQFGYDIFSTPDSNVSVGYRYAASSVVETAQSDRLQAMESEAAKKPLPGMAAPAKSEAKPENKKK